MFSWSISWQKNINRWKDLFNFDYRIEEKNNVNIKYGNVSINPYDGDWPMFGRNPQNTRSTTTKGPDEYKQNWWCQIGDKEYHEITNSVILDESLYTTYEFSNKIFVIEDISYPSWPGHNEIDYNYEIDLGDFGFPYLVNSPTLTEDKIITATGRFGPQGTENYIIAINRENLGLEWVYQYPENICYSSTPIIYDNKVFVTSWSGDPDLLQSNNNNKAIALDLTSGDLVWEFDLPAKSITTPAANNNTIFVGCGNKKGNSIFAIDSENGELIWTKSIGEINKASPVIFENTLFIISKGGLNRIILNALESDTGEKIWEKEICNSFLAKADCTPAIHDDVAYVSSPNGYLYAFDIQNLGTTIWQTKLYNKGLFGDCLSTSPAYSNNIVYIGTPSGSFYALDATNGQIMDNWSDFSTFKRIRINGEWIVVNGHPPVVTSPIISNGLVFFGDDNGKLYSLGEYEEPTDQEISGRIVSTLIKLPEDYSWGKFYASYKIWSENSMAFSILDEEKNLIKEIDDGETIPVHIEEPIRLCADLYAKNFTFNPQLFDWHVTFIQI
jgi:outer membrane protein assembly factor BamB